MSEQKIDLTEIIEQFVDYLMPELTPRESSMYIFLLRNSFLKNGESKIRKGQKTLAKLYGRGVKSAFVDSRHLMKSTIGLNEKGCIRIGDTNREGTLYEILLPSEIPLVLEKLISSIPDEEEDYYNNPEKRKELYERDQWICQYCGEKVSAENVTLDHFIPRSRSGSNKKENLRTACLMCNSVKSGKTYEEAAVHLLKSIQERKKRSSENT
jgi:hypothetical protein